MFKVRIINSKGACTTQEFKTKKEALKAIPWTSISGGKGGIQKMTTEKGWLVRVSE